MLLDSEVVQKPSLWKRFLIASTLGRDTFNDNMTPLPFVFYHQYTYLNAYHLMEFLDDIEGYMGRILLATSSVSLCGVLLVLANHPAWKHNLTVILALLATAILWPLAIFIAGGIAMFLLLLFMYFPVRGSLVLLASIFCRTELEYYKIRNQARIDEDVRDAIEDHMKKSYTPGGTLESRQNSWIEGLKEFSSEY
jgi:hypothetical protein